MLVADVVHSIHGLYMGGTPYRVRLFRVAPRSVMLVTALTANMGITNMVEYLAAQIAINHRDLFPDGQPFAYIEHYPADGMRIAAAYHGVVFTSYRVAPGWREGEARMRLGLPQWVPMTQQEVEELIGQRVDE